MNEGNASVAERTLGEELKAAGRQEAVNQPVGITTGMLEEGQELSTARGTATAQNQQRQAAHFERQAAQQEARAARLTSNGATEQAAIVERRAASSRLAGDIARRSYPKYNWAKVGVGVGIGIAGAAVNFMIERSANKFEDDRFRNVLKGFGDINLTNNDSGKQGVNIVAFKS